MENVRIYNPKEIEKQTLDFWEKKKIPESIVNFDEKKKKFYILDGPPYVNDNPHVGHIMTTTFKDVWGKFKTMQGHTVWFQPGFDCGGLPIENKVEKNLGLMSKRDIEKIGIDKFIQECNNFAKGNEKTWLEIYKQMGVWRGWLKPYLTSENYYIESGWWTLKKLYEKGLLVEGEKPGFWCAHCETVLAGYEVTDSYKNIEDHSIYVKFPVKGKQNEFFIVWTTTPWTLPSNVVICVHPDEKYVKVETEKHHKIEVLILAEKRLPLLEELEIKYKIIKKLSGKELEGEKYSPILDIPLQHELENNENAHRVILSVALLKKRVASKLATKKATQAEEEFGHIVDMDTGSGIIHIAPGHGEIDNKLGKHYNLPQPSPVDEQGKLKEETGKFAGKYVKTADTEIIDDLNAKGFLFYPGKITHSYPLCWRCKTPLIYRLSKQWFLKIDTLKEQMLRENEKVNWLPEFGRERFHNLLIDAPDWPVTRQRFWGIPIPVWLCDSCGARKVIGSVKELREHAVEKLPAEIDLHKNSADRIHLKCDECGKKMTRLADIMDVWFDSGISPWASLGYPFRNKHIFEKLWPVDLIDESQDQVRGWFYYLMFAGVAAFGKRPYNTVCLNGWVLDEKGEKMSKSLGNVVWGKDALNELGVDTLRLYYCSDVAPWDTQKFSMKNAKDMQKILNILWNTYMFIEYYSDKNVLKSKPSGLLPEDKWLISRINTITQTVTDDLENFRFHNAGRALIDFILNDYSRWYVKLVRDRVSPWNVKADKQSAQYSLVYTLERLLRILAPMTPFISEHIYQKLGFESVHLAQWPQPETKLMDKKLEKQMETAKKIFEASSSMRQESDIKQRWPLSAIHVKTKDKTVLDSIKNLKSVIEFMCNAKDIRTTGLVEAKMKKFEDFELGLGSVLEEESFIRELVRKIQIMRKEHRLDVREPIELWLDTDEKTTLLIRKRTEEIQSEVGANTIHLPPALEKTATKTRKIHRKKHLVKNTQKGIPAPKFRLENRKGEIELEGRKIVVGFASLKKI